MKMKRRLSTWMVFVCAMFFGSQWAKAASVADVALYKGKDRQSKIEEGAKKEGELVWYTSLAVEDSQQVLQLFEKRYPFVKIKLTRLTSERALQRYLAEFQAGRFLADIIDTNDFQMSSRAGRARCKPSTLHRWTSMTSASSRLRASGWQAG